MRSNFEGQISDSKSLMGESIGAQTPRHLAYHIK